jgi:choline kinase
MNLFILAAGKGERLWPLTKDTPKSLLDLGDGTTLLERQINNAIKSKIFNEIFIITGYLHEKIEEAIKKYKTKIKITTIYNPFFDITNNLVSLWTARCELLVDDFMITNGDNIYKNNVFNKVFNNFRDFSEVIAITIDYKTNYDDDDMKVILDKNKNVLRVHKKIPIEKTQAESVGLTLIKGKNSRQNFVNAILNMVKNKDKLNIYWLDIFNFLVEKGKTVKAVEIGKDDWREMDFHPDKEILRKLILEEKRF